VNTSRTNTPVTNALVNATHEILTPDCLPANIRSGAPLMHEVIAAQANALNVSALVRRLLKGGEGEIYDKAHFAMDRAVLNEVLKHVNGNQVEAARCLGISRTTLRAKLQALGKFTSNVPTSESEQSVQ